METKQGNRSNLLAEQERFDDARLTASFIAMPSTLPCRPAPRHWWDNAASPGRVPYRGNALLLPCRSVLYAAIALRDREVLEQSAVLVDHHLHEFAACAMRPYTRIVSGETSLDEAADAAARETADLSASITHWAIRHDETARDEMVRALDAEILRLTALRAQLTDATVAINDRPRLVRA